MKKIIFCAMILVGIRALALDLPQPKTTPEAAASAGALQAAEKHFAKGVCTVSDVTQNGKGNMEARYSVFLICPQFPGDASGIAVEVIVKTMVGRGQLLYFADRERVIGAPPDALH